MDTHDTRRDTWQSVLLIAAAVGLVAGLRLATYETLYYQAAVTVLGGAITALSALAVFVQRRRVGAAIVACALATALLLLTADFYTVQAVIAAALAAAAGMVVMAVPTAADRFRAR